jgi:phage terminase Nu1 subunit (DNA packaging protein)
MTQQELARIFRVSCRTIRHWQTEGMPVQEQNHSGNEYRLSEVLEWYLSEELAVNFSTRKLDSLRLKHTKLELECEFLRLELIRTNEVENTWATIRNEFQQKISQIPEQIPASILKITNLVDAKQQLREIFAQTLEDLSKLKPQTKAE